MMMMQNVFARKLVYLALALWLTGVCGASLS